MTRAMEGGEGEGDELWDEFRGKERALKVVDREHTHEVLHLAPMASGDNLELIEKWKALIDTKDRILKQKNAQIERYVCIQCTCMVLCACYFTSNCGQVVVI